MVNPRHSKFELNPSERLISSISAHPDAFATALLTVDLTRIDYLVQAYIRDRTPFAFEKAPMLWGALRNWLTRRVNSQCDTSISPWEWGLSGSANLGFSASPNKFGVAFGAHSDLDFFVVNKRLYELIAREGRLFSASNSEIQRYQEARKTVDQQLTRGLFLDTKQIPASEKFPNNALLLNEISIIVAKLHVEGYQVQRSFVRVYESWHGLATQLRINIKSLRSSLATR